jgi:hypothetical protein
MVSGCRLKEFLVGLPPLIFSGGSSNTASIPVDHEGAESFVKEKYLADIGVVNNPFLKDISIIWKTALRSNGGKLHWGSESDIQDSSN